MHSNTAVALAGITDTGLFERLASDILRHWDERCRSLVHSGLNVEGKPIKSPVDGITFTPDSTQSRLIAIHHTTCAAKDLKRKWLHAPSPRESAVSASKAKSPPGDIVKTVKLIEEHRERVKDLRATLILTTNQEPPEALVRDVHAAGIAHNVDIEIWSRSTLVNLLDNYPHGQWLRRQYLGIDQVILSKELLRELSRKSLDTLGLPDGPDEWVSRTLDKALNENQTANAVFVVADSGAGKTVACCKRLMTNLSYGGFSLVLSESDVDESVTFENAVERTLKQLHPSLIEGCGAEALKLADAHSRLLVTIEDINRNGKGSLILEKIVRWDIAWRKAKDGLPIQILCCVWPQVISAVSSQLRDQVFKGSIFADALTPEEGCAAVSRRLELRGIKSTPLSCQNISNELGHDPLLIALHDPKQNPDAGQTISRFVEECVQHASQTSKDVSATECTTALGALMAYMLREKILDPSWSDIVRSPETRDHLQPLRALVHQRRVVRLSGSSDNEKIAFRHDRVRSWLLARSATGLFRDPLTSTDILSEPCFAEVLGLASVLDDCSHRSLYLLGNHNPLALFFAAAQSRNIGEASRSSVFDKIDEWLTSGQPSDLDNGYLRSEASLAISETEHPRVLSLARKLDKGSWSTLRARYINGDVYGGIWLCYKIEFGIHVSGHDTFLDHVRDKFGGALTSTLSRIISGDSLSREARVGALRLAGHIGDPSLADAIRRCWAIDERRSEHLEDYLWACAQCVDNEPETILGPICDAWAQLPHRTNEIRQESETREDLAAHNIRWAFRSRLPPVAVSYLIERAKSEELRWPITYLMHGIDHPDAVEFIARELVSMTEKYNFSHFSASIKDDWQRQEREFRKPMSEDSRKHLQGFWSNPGESESLRLQAFRLWSASCKPSDIDILKNISSNDQLYEEALWERLRLSDRSAIPDLIPRLDDDAHGYWWQLGRHVWSAELTGALNRALATRDTHGDKNDWSLSEMLMRLPSDVAEGLLRDNWDNLSKHSHYVIAALYFATPLTLRLAAEAIERSAEPYLLLDHISLRFGFNTVGHPGVSNPRQIEAVVPYLDLLHEHDLNRIWEACNERGWYDLRRKHFDSRVAASYPDVMYLDDSKAMNYLDDLADREIPFVDFWIDRFVRTGSNLDHVMNVVEVWLVKRSDLPAIRVAGNALLHVGRRRFLKIFGALEPESRDMFKAEIRNIEYAVRRRSLHV